MTLPWTTPLQAATAVALILFSVAVFLCTVRLAIGPSLPDRVVALDTVGVLLVTGLIVYGIAEMRADAVRVAAVLALINFIGTVGFASFSGKRARE